MIDHAPLLERVFSVDPRQESYAIDRIDGNIPAFVRGTYYLNGPARFARGGLDYRHWLDGDGMVCCLRFEEGQIHFANRFVRSAKFRAEEEAGRPLFRTFGTSFDGDQLVRGIALASPVNVSVYPYAGRLLAFGEQGLPWELDPVSLETRGEYNFGGRLNAISPFSAHPKFCWDTGEMFNFGVSFGRHQPNLNLYRFDGRGAMLYRQRLPLEYPCSLHDFGLSERHAVFYLSPYNLDMRILTEPGRTLLDALCWKPQFGSRLLVCDRQTGTERISLPLKARYCLHFINCYETESDQLVVDVLELDRPIYDQYQVIPDLFSDVGPGRPVRYIVDLDSGALAGRSQIDYSLAPDFAAVDPRWAQKPYRHFWMLGIGAQGQPGRKFFDQLVRADWQDLEALDIYRAPAGCYLGGEPVFVGDGTERRAGTVICQLFDAEKVLSAFVLFDAFDLSRGPRATLHLKHPVPLGFHTAFSQSAL